MLYVLSLTGYEAYEPYWFECDCSKVDFKKAVEESVNYATSVLVGKIDGFIDGYVLLEKVKIRLQKHHHFKYVKPDYEIMIGGECLYADYNEKPEVISDNDWKKILEHNQKIHDDVCGDKDE